MLHLSTGLNRLDELLLICCSVPKATPITLDRSAFTFNLNLYSLALNILPKPTDYNKIKSCFLVVFDVLEKITANLCKMECLYILLNIKRINWQQNILLTNNMFCNISFTLNLKELVTFRHLLFIYMPSPGRETSLLINMNLIYAILCITREQKPR